MIRRHNCIVDDCPEEDYPPSLYPFLPVIPKIWRGERGKQRRAYCHLRYRSFSRRTFRYQHVKCPFIQSIRKFFYTRRRSSWEPHSQCNPMAWRGNIGTGSATPWSDHKFPRKRTRWNWKALRMRIRGEISLFSSKLGWTSKHHKSLLAISCDCRSTGNSERRQQEAQIGGETTLFKKTSGKPENNNNCTSRHSRGGCDRLATARDDVDRAELAV